VITEAEEKEILALAYVPEHVVELMTLVSGGELFLVEDYLCCRTGDLLVVVGYPLKGEFHVKAFETLLERLIRDFRPRSVLFIAPEIPGSLAKACVEHESDSYYRRDLDDAPIPRRLLRIVEKAGEHARVERAHHLGPDHRRLADEFVERVDPPPRVRALLFSMWQYVAQSDGSLVLNAWSSQDELAAFYVLDLTARSFSTYVIGCHSKRHYVKWASDLLFYEMIQVSMESGKSYIHLGLGVNEGIRRFKQKWGGAPFLAYEMCRVAVRRRSFFDAIMSFRARA